MPRTKRQSADPAVHREGGALYEGSSRCKPLAPGRLEAWKAIHDLGEAGRVCDSITRNRPAPLYLLAVLDWPRHARIPIPEVFDDEQAAQDD